jgi:hypothetical protein
VAFGFFNVEVFPFPKSHNQEVGLPVDRSWNDTTRGEQPDTGVALKLATGAWPETALVPERAITNKAVRFVRIL